MKFTIDKKEHYSLLSLQEDKLNTMIAPNLKSEFVILRNEGVDNLILDLSSVSFVDSSGLSAILTARRLWEDEGSFILTGIDHENVKKLIEISRLHTVLKIIPTIQESIDYILMEVLEKELKGKEQQD